MQGRRLADGFHYKDAEPGDYWRQSHGTTEDPGAYAKRNVDFSWCVRDPNGVLGTLRSHAVEEHEDGTITVTPSILDPHDYTPEELRAIGIVSIIDGQNQAGWHGWLERGVWRQA